MTTPNHPERPNRSESDVDALFAELASSMPELASIDPATGDDDLERVEVMIPRPGLSGKSIRLVLEVPAEVASMVRAELSPDRIAAMMQAINAFAALSSPPRP